MLLNLFAAADLSTTCLRQIDLPWAQSTWHLRFELLRDHEWIRGKHSHTRRSICLTIDRAASYQKQVIRHVLIFIMSDHVAQLVQIRQQVAISLDSSFVFTTAQSSTDFLTEATNLIMITTLWAGGVARERLLGASALLAAIRRHLETLKHSQVTHHYIDALARIRKTQKLDKGEIADYSAGDLEFILRFFIQVSHKVAHDEP